ncbi:GNAT family N-acetyltransferase [Albibacillus kandeliae]|uniref:GNAT family N-acetyltransferase n=1 Tax=Albibacillus kandeliae TaxID=2174228 RepID=UPI000D688090|nr:GNAT family N-acetyltransferase [Albibacillus kandeliae]
MIRQARPEDDAAVRAVAEEAYAQYVAAIGRKPAPMTADYTALIAEGVLYVAETAPGEVGGFIVYFPQDGVMFLENIAVHSSAAGEGLGKALMAHCEDTARDIGLPAIELYTNEKMTANLSIYPHLGYVETGRREEDGFNRVYFRKAL